MRVIMTEVVYVLPFKHETRSKFSEIDDKYAQGQNMEWHQPSFWLMMHQTRLSVAINRR